MHPRLLLVFLGALNFRARRVSGGRIGKDEASITEMEGRLEMLLNAT
jgi:hypothetical protein